MNNEKDYLHINRNSWNHKTDIHLKSDFYDMASFLKGKSSLKEIEINLLGQLKDASVLHLQCHFGQDTISLSRLGASVTGVDFSDNAIRHAQQIAADTNSNARFICCDIYDLALHLDEKFDLVFSSYGTIGWLPDLDKWAGIVSKFLKPGGRFVFVEFHPFVWMYDDSFEKISYRYFNSGPIAETESGTYADKTADITQDYIMWNHGLSEVLSSLIQNGLEIQSVKEYDYSPYDCFQKTIEFEPGKFRLKPFGDMIPLVYSLVATKK